MLYFGNPSKSPELVQLMAAGLVGYIDTPAQGNARPPDLPAWCADNGRFGKGWPGEDAWLAWLDRNASAAGTCWFATAPDVVGDAEATLDTSVPLLGAIRSRGYRAALVAQNGVERLSIPWSQVDVIFLGGLKECLRCGYVRPIDAPGTGNPRTLARCPECHRILTEWKEGQAAAELSVEAIRRGKQVHMGRVNTGRRYHHAYDIGCSSVDGTMFTQGVDRNLAELQRWERDARQHPRIGTYHT